MPTPRNRRGLAVLALYRRNQRRRGPDNERAIGRPGSVFGNTRMGRDLTRAEISGVTDTETLRRALADPASRDRLRSIPFEIREIERRGGKNKKGLSARQRDRIARLQREAAAINEGRERVQKELDRRSRSGKKAGKQGGNVAKSTKGAAKKAADATETTTKRTAKTPAKKRA